MRYMMLIYSSEGPMSPEQEREIALRHREVMEEAKQRGIFHGAEPLQPTSTAITIRNDKERTLVTDGPFAETKEQLAGYYILDCASQEEAIEWGKKIPTGCFGREGSLEIRPIWSTKIAID